MVVYSARGVTLLEALLALILFAVGLLAVTAALGAMAGLVRHQALETRIGVAGMREGGGAVARLCRGDAVAPIAVAGALRVQAVGTQHDAMSQVTVVVTSPTRADTFRLARPCAG